MDRRPRKKNAKDGKKKKQKPEPVVKFKLAHTGGGAKSRIQELPVSAVHPTFLLHHSRDYFRRTLARGTYEPEITAHARKLVTRESAVLVIGANIGIGVIDLARRVQKVVAFEPAKEAFAQLCANVVLNRTWNVDFRMQAVGHRDGFASIDFDPTSGGDAMYQIVDGAQHPKSIEVPMVALDSVDWKGTKFDLVKIDVEGFELNVLQGAQRFLAEHRPHIIIEIWPENVPAVRAWLEANAYDLALIHKDDFHATPNGATPRPCVAEVAEVAKPILGAEKRKFYGWRQPTRN